MFIFRIFFPSVLSYRSSYQNYSIEKGVFKNFTKFKGKHLCQSLFFNKVAGLRPATPFFMSLFWWLLLHLSVSEDLQPKDRYMYSGISIKRTLYKADISLKRTVYLGMDGFTVKLLRKNLYKAERRTLFSCLK